MYEVGLTALTGGIVGVMMALIRVGWSHPAATALGAYLGMMVSGGMALLLFGTSGWTDPLPWLVGMQLTWGLYQLRRILRQTPPPNAPIMPFKKNRAWWKQGMIGWQLGSIPFWIGSPLLTPLPGGPLVPLCTSLCLMGIGHTLPLNWSHTTVLSPNRAITPVIPLTQWVQAMLTSFREGFPWLVGLRKGERKGRKGKRFFVIPSPPMQSSGVFWPEWARRWAVIRHWQHHPAHRQSGSRQLSIPMPLPLLDGSADALFQSMAPCFEGYHPFCHPGFWTPTASIAQSEWEMMARLTEWAGIKDGDRLIEMGCGGGGLTVYWGRRFPHSSIVAVTQSPSQQLHVIQRCQDAGLTNITVVQGPHTEWYDGNAADRCILHPTLGYPSHDPHTYHLLRPLLKEGGTLVAHALTHKTHFYSIDSPLVPVLGYWIPHGIIPSHGSLIGPHDGYQWSDTTRYEGPHLRRSARAWQNLVSRQPKKEWVSNHLLPSLWVLEAMGADPNHSFGMSLGRWKTV